MKKIIHKAMLLSLILSGGGTPALADPLGLYAGAGTGLVVNTENNDGHYRGVPLTLYAGVAGMMDPCLYLAGEIFGNVTTADLNNDGLNSTYSWGASVIPGWVLSEHVLGFLRIGGVRNHFSWTNKTGGELGLGLQTRLTHEWDLRGEYDYIQYNGSLKTDQFAVALLYKFF